MNLLAKNLLILASAGSGKTYQLSNRIIGLAARGAAPERMVALTFTRKAAGEFTDALLTKLAAAASEPRAAAGLSSDIGIHGLDFPALLRSTVRALPRISFGTMDGFFAKIVRGFQYELGLTGGRFELIEGPKAASAADELLGEILGNSLSDAVGEAFFHAFRRSLIGREEQGILVPLRSFVRSWQSIYQEFPSLRWGPAELSGADFVEWEIHKGALANAASKGMGDITFTDKRQPAALDAAISALEQHTIGSGSLGSKAPKLLSHIIEACASHADGPLPVKFQKEFFIQGATATHLRQMVSLAARCEFAAALARTRAIREVVAVFDALCSKRLRQKGMLGFNEVKLLMGEWVANEDARLRREAVDFRLDARHDHWLLDEFQDTSQSEWRGLQPLIDEAASAEDGSVFVVGDRKQAIYSWRGGDVGLFDEIIRRYGRELEISPMAESWRSSPEVLSLVNRICGDLKTLHELFGDAASHWDWQPHASAPPLQSAAKRGHAVVEITGDWEARLERMRSILTQLQVNQRGISCGILLRGNKEVAEVAEFLRAHDFDVIEEGQREPSKDNPTGIFILHLLNWLSNPADLFSREVVSMSPFCSSLQSRFGVEWWRLWENLTKQVSDVGFSSAVRSWIEPLQASLSEFARLRTGDILSHLTGLDSIGVASLQEIVKRLRELVIPQSPGSGAIQVMTIHKSKGLGFDVVILPEVPDTTIPQPQYFGIAFGTDWISQTPPKWARQHVHELRDAESKWEIQQKYESFCLLYVALTRAKRGLYVLLDEPTRSADSPKVSLAGWVSTASNMGDEIGATLEFGDSQWTGDIPPIASTPPVATVVKLAAHTTLPQIQRPSRNHLTSNVPLSAKGAGDGVRIHRALERISWIDESPPVASSDPLGKRILDLVHDPRLRFVFHRDGRRVELLREQALEIPTPAGRIRAVIDRLHLHRDPTGRIDRIELFDYKSDAETDPSVLSERHSPQISAYRQALETIHPNACVECHLISTTTGNLIRL